MPSQIQNMSIIGCGQIGASILLAMAEQGHPLPTTIYDIHQETEELVRERFAKHGFDDSHLTFLPSISETVKNADLIILATPMSTFESASREISKHTKVGAILTDTGSAKNIAIQNITKSIEGTDIKYVAAHPGNGSQGAGPLTASSGNILGKNSTMFIIAEEGENFSPLENSPEKIVNDFWKSIGVTTAFITTEKHDKFFGQCSHFQHALVFSLMGMATDEIAHNFEYAGTALRNLSRVAISVMKDNQPSALAQMWLPIFEQNKGPILEAHQRFKKHFSEFMELVENEDFDGLEKKLSEAKTFRDGFDDPERRETRETIEGEKEDLKKIPPFDAKEKGQLKNLFTRKSCPATATNLILPIVIAYAQTMSAKEIDAHFISLKANPSFRDGTHPVTYDSGYVTGLIKSNMPALKELSEDFQNKLSTLTDAIHESDKHIIEEFILLAQNNRNKMPPPRKNNDVRNSFENDR